MIRKVKVVTKNKTSVATETATKNNTDSPVTNITDNDTTELDTITVCQNADPTCIRIFIDNEDCLQYVNNMMMRFNVIKDNDNISLQRVGYKLNADNKPTEIDIAILHEDNYTVPKVEYRLINNYLSTRLNVGGVRYQFIEFEDSYRNSADCSLSIQYDNNVVTEFITLERGSIDDKLFSYLCDRYGENGLNIQSIRIPITEVFITYDAKWEKEEKSNNHNKSCDDKIQNCDEDCHKDSTNITICIYDTDASDNVDGLMAQFAKSIGDKVYDYTEQTPSKYMRVINLDIIRNSDGMRFIDSLAWVNNVIIDTK